MPKHSPQKMRTLLRIPSLLLALKINPYTTKAICETGCPLPINHSQYTQPQSQDKFAQHTNYQ